MKKNRGRSIAPAPPLLHWSSDWGSVLRHLPARIGDLLQDIGSSDDECVLGPAQHIPLKTALNGTAGLGMIGDPLAVPVQTQVHFELAGPRRRHPGEHRLLP